METLMRTLMKNISEYISEYISEDTNGYYFCFSNVTQLSPTNQSIIVLDVVGSLVSFINLFFTGEQSSI